MTNINIVMRYFEISESSPQEEERLKRAREQGFNVDDPHYHGTPGGDFDEFDPYRTADEDLAYGAGIYMSRDPDAASGYSRPGTSWGNHIDDARPTVYKVYHRVKNPFDMSKFYPYTEVKRIMEHCFTEDELESIPFWQEIQEEVQYSSGTSEEWEELSEYLMNLESGGRFDDMPDPDRYEDGEDDPEYIEDEEEARKYEIKSIQKRIQNIEERTAREYEDHKKMVATGRKGSALGKEIYRTLWTNTSEYHDWKAESQLFGGETETFEFKTEANRWLEELGYDGLTHVDRYNPGNKGVSHNVTIAFHPQQVRSAHANFDPEKIDSPKLSESYREEATSTFGDDGVLYRLNDIFKSTEKALAFDIPVSKLTWQIEAEEDEDRINHADCSVPILVWKKGHRLVLVDGMHRLHKAIRLGLPTLPAKYVLDTIMKKAKISEAILTEKVWLDDRGFAFGVNPTRREFMGKFERDGAAGVLMKNGSLAVGNAESLTHADLAATCGFESKDIEYHLQIWDVLENGTMSIEVELWDENEEIQRGTSKKFPKPMLDKIRQEIQANPNIARLKMPVIVTVRDPDWEVILRENSDGKITLTDLYDNSELYDRSEAIGQLVDSYGSGLLSERFTVREMMPADAMKLKSFGGTSIRSAFRKAASKEQKEIVQNKKTQFDSSRIIVLSRNRIVDGHHHLIAAIQLNRPVKYIDLEEEPLTEVKKQIAPPTAGEILTLIKNHYRNNDVWTRGDCGTFATLISKLTNGEAKVYVIGSEGMLLHAIVELDGEIFDGRQRYNSLEAAAAKYNNAFCLPARFKSYPGYPRTKIWFNDKYPKDGIISELRPSDEVYFNNLLMKLRDQRKRNKTTTFKSEKLPKDGNYRYTKGLNELARPKTRVQADEILRNAGYSRLGNGAFGAVYRKPGKPYVLKVFTAKDQAYRDFVALAMAHKNNPHFPRFIGNIVHVTPDICAIRMEPLTPYKHNHSLITTYLRWRDYKSNDPNFISIELENAKEILTPKLKKACDLIIDNLMTRYACDLKKENLMMRGSTIVFTDPVSSNPEDSGVVLSSQPHDSTYNSADDALLKTLFAESDYKFHYIPNDERSERLQNIKGYGIATKAGANTNSFGNRIFSFPLKKYKIDPKDVVGSVYIKTNQSGQLHGSSLNVDDAHRRKQVASNLYNHIENELDDFLVPEDELSPDGKRFWAGRGKYSKKRDDLLKESYHPEMISNENIKWTKSAKQNAELAANLLRKAGFNAFTENPSGRKTDSRFAAIGSKTNGILVNPRCGYWKDPVAAAQLNFKVGHLSTDHPLGVLLHEIAHIIYDAPDNWFTNLHKEVAKRVSKYAASNPKEFVSEVYAGINTGKTYDDEVMKFYNMYARK